MRARVALLPLAALVLSACSGTCCPRPCATVARGPLPAVAPAAGNHGDAAPLEAKRIKGLHFEEASLDQVVTYLNTVTGFSFVVSPGARAVGSAGMRVTLALDDVSARQVLDLVTAPNGLRWRVEDYRVVRISTQDEAPR